MIRLCTILAISVATLAGAAHAGQRYNDNFPYWYLGLNGQLSYVPDADVDGSAVGYSNVQFDTGYALGASIGYRPYSKTGFLKGARFEVEYTYRDTDFDNVDTAIGTANLDGDLISHNAMFNVYYDFATEGTWKPYVGAGIGMAFMDFKSTTLNVDDTDDPFAYQGMVGIYYEPASLPNTEWGIGYRYFATTDVSYRDRAGNDFEHDYNSHNLEFLTRFRF